MWIVLVETELRPEVSLFQPIENDFYDRYDLQDPQDPYDLPFLSSLDDAFPGK